MIAWHGRWFGARGFNTRPGVNLAAGQRAVALVINGASRRLYLCLSLRGVTVEVSRLSDHGVLWLFTRCWARGAS